MDSWSDGYGVPDKWTVHSAAPERVNRRNLTDEIAEALYPVSANEM
ncbi:hypothetical protein J3A64_001775 [Pseudarthrobacter sp. PvP004]|nr:hypothetical protein [Pseudarthrobacter sp. PvP004]